MPEENGGGLATSVLTKQLDAMLQTITRQHQERKEFDQQLARQRHDVNEKMSGVMSSLTLEVKLNGDKVEKLATTVGRLGEEVKDLKVRVAGNPELESDGLIQEVASFREVMKDLAKRVADLETDRKSALRIWAFTAGLCAGLAGIIYFLFALWDRIKDSAP